MSRSAPSCAFLGDGAAALAAKALRRAGGGEVPLLIRWGVVRERGGGLASVRSALRAERDRLRDELPDGWTVSIEARAVVVDAIPGEGAPTVIESLLRTHAGPLALAIGVLRDDEVDRLLRIVDEVVVVAPAVQALVEQARVELEPVASRLTVVPPTRSAWSVLLGGEEGQTLVVALAVISTLAALAIGLGMVATALGRASDVQGRADVAALAGAKALLEAQPLLYSQDPDQRISPAQYRARGQQAAERSAAANGLRIGAIGFVGDDEMPTRVRVRALSREAGGDSDRAVVAVAEVAVASLDTGLGAGDYQGPFATRQGQRMRPDVALAFDRMNAAATAAGHALVIVSAFRSDAEQAVLFARHPDPKWVAPPGKSLHRLGTELDLGPASAYAWLGTNATRFGFLQRYSWEAWHFGYTRSAGSASLGYARVSSDTDPGGSEKATRSAIPSFVPATYAPIIAAAAQRWSVGAALLGAQIQVESGFDPNAQSPYAAGIAQFTPGTAAQYGMSPAERFDPTIEIPAQAHLMHDLLAKFGSVPLALAAYNAGEGAVGGCMCVPAIPETQAYVQKILALLGAGGLSAAGGLQIRLVA